MGYTRNASKFVVLPVALAEKLCRLHADFWSKVPAKKRDEGGKLGQRSDSFPLYLCFTKSPRTNTAHHERVMRNLHAFTDKWSVLNEPIKKLHDAKAWPLLK